MIRIREISLPPEHDVNQLGYEGIAIWTQSGSTDSLESLYSNLAPGKIYLWHTTDNDLNKLLQFMALT